MHRKSFSCKGRARPLFSCQLGTTNRSILLWGLNEKRWQEASTEWGGCNPWATVTWKRSLRYSWHRCKGDKNRFHLFINLWPPNGTLVCGWRDRSALREYLVDNRSEIRRFWWSMQIASGIRVFIGGVCVCTCEYTSALGQMGCQKSTGCLGRHLDVCMCVSPPLYPVATLLFTSVFASHRYGKMKNSNS